MRARYAGVVAVVVAGVVAALIELSVSATSVHSRWIYLLLIGLGIVRPPVKGVPRA